MPLGNGERSGHGACIMLVMAVSFALAANRSSFDADCRARKVGGDVSVFCTSKHGVPRDATAQLMVKEQCVSKFEIVVVEVCVVSSIRNFLEDQAAKVFRYMFLL